MQHHQCRPDKHAFAKHYGAAEDFLYSRSQNRRTEYLRLFHRTRLPLKVEARKRAFPETENAPDVTRVLKSISRTRRSRSDGKRGRRIAGRERPHHRSRHLGRYVPSGKVLSSRQAECLIRRRAPQATASMAHLSQSHRISRFTLRRAIESAGSVDQVTRGNCARTDEAHFLLRRQKAFSKRQAPLHPLRAPGPLILNSAREVNELLKEGDVTASIDLFPELDLAALEKKVLTQ